MQEGVAVDSLSGHQYSIKFAIIPASDGGGYLAYSDEFPGLLNDGPTEEEAEEGLHMLIFDALQHRQKLNSHEQRAPDN